MTKKAKELEANEIMTKESKSMTKRPRSPRSRRERIP